MMDGKKRRRIASYKWVLVPIVIICAFVCASCSPSTATEPIPSGYISKKEHFDRNGVQDYTDYCTYQYTSANAFQQDKRYHAISAEDVGTVAGYFDHFEQWMRAENRLSEYDFAPSCISADDYLLTVTKEGQAIGSGFYGKYDHYSVYFFDMETMTLYYIHQNI